MSRARSLLAVVCVIVALGAVLLVVRRQPEPGSSTQGSPTEPQGTRITPEVERELERLATLGYIAGSEPAPDNTGVLTHDREAAFAGLTLFTLGGVPEALLIDMDGDVMHSWSAPGSMYWARAFVMPNGDLFVVTANPAGMMKLNSDSEVIWRYDKKAHHDFAVMPDESTYVLVRETVSIPGFRDGEPFLDDHVVLLDPMGRELRRVSLLEAFESSELGRQWLVDHPVPEDGDIFHTNSIEMLGSIADPRVLLSIRSIDTVAILDFKEGRMIWAMDGPWHMQHEAQLIDGNLLLFDNLGLSRTTEGVRQSRVLEIDTETREIVWSYAEPGFFSHGAGAQQRLPNGNTLITESIKGRLIEVTRDGDIVWEYVNPLTLEEDPDVVLAIMRAERVPPDVTRGWAHNP